MPFRRHRKLECIVYRLQARTAGCLGVLVNRRRRRRQQWHKDPYCQAHGSSQRGPSIMVDRVECGRWGSFFMLLVFLMHLLHFYWILTDLLLKHNFLSS